MLIKRMLDLKYQTEKDDFDRIEKEKKVQRYSIITISLAGLIVAINATIIFI